MDTAASFNLVSISLSLSLRQIYVSPDRKSQIKNFSSWRREEEEPGAGKGPTPHRSHSFGNGVSWDRSRKEAETYKRKTEVILERDLYNPNKTPPNADITFIIAIVINVFNLRTGSFTLCNNTAKDSSNSIFLQGHV